jgi:cytochrome c
VGTAGSGIGRAAALGARVTVSGLAWVAATIGATAEPLAADVGEGERLYAKHCLVCHAVEPGYHREGPSLAGVFGRRAGTAPLFGHYRGLKGATVVWNEQTLDRWLDDPRAFLGGRDTSMTYKLPAADDRAAVIAYLRTLR